MELPFSGSAPFTYCVVGEKPYTPWDARPRAQFHSSLHNVPLGYGPLPALTQAGSTPEGCKLGEWLWAWQGHCRKLGAPSCCPASGGSHTW